VQFFIYYNGIVSSQTWAGFECLALIILHESTVRATFTILRTIGGAIRRGSWGCCTKVGGVKYYPLRGVWKLPAVNVMHTEDWSKFYSSALRDARRRPQATLCNWVQHFHEQNAF